MTQAFDAPSNPRPRRRWGYRLAVVALALAGTATAYWLLRPAPGGTGPAFDTAVLDRGPIQRSVSATGAVQAVVTVQIGSQLSGQVADVLVDFNSAVKKGDLLARIDPQTFRSKVAQAEADLQVAGAGVAVREAAERKARAQLRQKTQDLARQRSLARDANVSRSALETAETDVALAEADLESAHSEVANAHAAVAQKEASLAQSRIDLERTEIRSAIEGVVIERAVDPGQTVAASLQAPILFRIAQDLSQIQIEAQVNEADIGDIREGNPATFTVDAFPDRRFTGSVRQKRLAAVTVNNVVTYTVIIEATNPGRILLPGMTATAEIVTGRREGALRIPNEALRFVPPADLAVAEGAGEVAPGAGGGRLLKELAAALSLSDTLIQSIQDSLGPAGGADLPAGERPDPEARRQRLENVLRRLLSPEQWVAYESWRTERGETRPGKVWVLGPGGSLEARRLRLGIADQAHTEVVSGALREGDAVVLRTRQGKPR